MVPVTGSTAVAVSSDSLSSELQEPLANYHRRPGPAPTAIAGCGDNIVLPSMRLAHEEAQLALHARTKQSSDVDPVRLAGGLPGKSIGHVISTVAGSMDSSLQLHPFTAKI